MILVVFPLVDQLVSVETTLKTLHFLLKHYTPSKVDELSVKKLILPLLLDVYHVDHEMRDKSLRWGILDLLSGNSETMEW